MAKLNSLLDMGRRSMSVTQSALHTASHNMANKSTEGFSKQRVDLETSPPVGTQGTQFGNGVKLAGITRTTNPWVDKQIEKEGANLAFQEGRSNALQRLETAFNEQSVKGLSNSINDFFNSFRELANNPESLTVRNVVRESASAMIRNFQDVNRIVKSVNSELDGTISQGVEQINAHVKEIADLNLKISTVEMAGGAANDDRDRRDLLVKKLAEKIDISSAEDEKTGMLNITAGKTGILVAGTSSTSLKAQKNQDGKMLVMYKVNEQSKSFDLTDQFKRGALGGALDLREGYLADIQDSVGELAYNIAHEVNKAHSEGFDRYNKQGGSFFELAQDGSFSIEDFKLNQQINKDVGRIAASAKPFSPADNTVANVIHSLQFKPILGEQGSFTFEDFYTSKVSEVGTMSQKAQAGLESQQNIVNQLKNVRESVSGVSMDEEAQKIIEYQKSFEASARLIRMADEMFDTVLNLKRY